MRFSTFFGTVTVSIALPFVVSAGHIHGARRHGDIARRDNDTTLEKRTFSDTRFTYYDITTGQVACEGYYKPSDYVVALNADQYGTYWKSSYCGKSISISYGGKTTTATVVDECPGCPYGGLDLTQGLFEFFADPSVGVLYGSWSWSDSSDDSDGSATTTTSAHAAATTPTTKAATTSTTARRTTQAATTHTSAALRVATKSAETTSAAATTTKVQPTTTSAKISSTSTQKASSSASSKTSFTSAPASSKKCSSSPARMRARSNAHIGARSLQQ